MKINKYIYKYNIKEELSNIYDNIIKECYEKRPIIMNELGNNFNLNSKYTKEIYKIFLIYLNKIFNKITLLDNDFNCWCYFSDNKFNKSRWHNHIPTCSINGVLYLKIPKDNKGIDFKIKNEILNVIPNEFDLLIFPDFLNHYPYPSINEPRIVLNLEIRCLEKSIELFK
jgi:hypothetical protein